MTAVRDGVRFERADRLATEEPMEIRVGGPGQEPAPVAVTMRTPGNDFELACGFLFTEALVSGNDEVVSVAYCELPGEEQRYNVVTVRLRTAFDLAGRRRTFVSSSSCGVCGKASLDQVELACHAIPPGPVLAGATVLGFPEALRGAQRIFEQTGGLHAAGMFEEDGRLVAMREDVGRHNAVDKLVGRALLAGALPLHGQALMVSGRVSFEIVQKAAMAGVPMICAVSAPSSLAVESARELGMTVVGFVRGSSFNVYTVTERVRMGG
jgi:FdhD protein